MVLDRRAGLLLLLLLWAWAPPAEAAGLRTRIFIVDSYHPEYLWSQDTATGVGKALVDFQFLDNTRQVDDLNANDAVESSRAVIKKAWMDTKRKNSKVQIGDATARIVNEIKVFNPDIILLGDDNAANYIGNHFMDREIPVVFWGINGVPLKYGLIDSIERPGHNVTGIYQIGYTKECLEYLAQLVPGIKTVGILSDDSETSRAKVKSLQAHAADGLLAVKLLEPGVTNSYAEWKEHARKFAEEADALVIYNHNTLKDDQGGAVEQMTAGAWYLKTIKKPECSDERQFSLEGMLLVVDDSGFKQGYEAIRYADDILRNNKPPAEMPIKAPERGAVMANRVRAEQLGISLDPVTFVEEIVDKAMALESKP